MHDYLLAMLGALLLRVGLGIGGWRTVCVIFGVALIAAAMVEGHGG